MEKKGMKSVFFLFVIIITYFRQKITSYLFTSLYFCRAFHHDLITKEDFFKQRHLIAKLKQEK